MTAIMSGVKTRAGVIGVDQVAERGNCASGRGNETVSALELAAVAGQSTGVVTTTRITHATPAATYGHIADRDWESDMEIPEKQRAPDCVDLARQLVEFPFGRGIDVALGGGRTEFMPADQRDPEYPALPGKRLDGRDLIAAWKQARRRRVRLERNAAEGDRSREDDSTCSASSSPSTCITKPSARRTRPASRACRR